MKSPPLLRMGMAAAMYLLLIWGHLSLNSPQWYAVFAALVLCSLLLYCLRETILDGLEVRMESDSLDQGSAMSCSVRTDSPSITTSLKRLDSLKSELMQQYAKFGQDQSTLNRLSRGSWHKHRDSSRPDT